jgi:protein-disulfide isomerase
MSCPHCREFFETTYQQLKAEYIDTNKIRFILREFPHNDAGLAGFMIARCAPKDKYYGLVDAMFKTQDQWLEDPRAGLFKIAQQAGFTQADFDACLKNEGVAKGILSVRQAAEGFGVTGIPTLFINGELYDGERTFEAMKSKIDPLLG